MSRITELIDYDVTDRTQAVMSDEDRLQQAEEQAEEWDEIWKTSCTGNVE